MKIREIIDLIEEVAPVDLAEENDKVKIGLQIGDKDAECSGVVTALDCTLEVLETAKENGCNLIVCHHPTIYFPLQEIDFSTVEGKIVEFAIKNGITVYSAHTNFDKCEIGTNATLMSLFGAKVTETCGCLFFGEIEEISLRALAKKIAEVLDDKSVRVVGDLDKKIKKICVCSGGGGSTFDMKVAISGGADVYISGDASHHGYLFAAESGLAFIEFSHYASEIVSEYAFQNYLKERIDNLKIIKANQKCPFRNLEEI